MLKPRPEVAIFASFMEAKLKKKDHRGKDISVVRGDFALDRIWDEVRELDRTAWTALNGSMNFTPELIDSVQRECEDISNFSAMLWWFMERQRAESAAVKMLGGE